MTESLQRSEAFQQRVDQEKGARIGNLKPNNSVTPPVAGEIGEINPDSIADFLRSHGMTREEIEGRFPSLKINGHIENIAGSILDLWDGQPPRSPQELMGRIGALLRIRMSYNLAEVLFQDPKGGSYPDMLRSALLNPNAKYGLSSLDWRALENLATSIRLNSDGMQMITRTERRVFVQNISNFSPREMELIDKLERYGSNANWLKTEAVNNPDMQSLLQKIATRYGHMLVQSKYGETLHTNQNASRDIYETLATIRVGVCRDFAMMAKRIYAEVAPKYFPDSEVFYVENHQERHAYNVLMYERGGQIVKEYYDPTSLITGGWFRMIPDGKMHGSPNEVWANNTEWPSEQLFT